MPGLDHVTERVGAVAAFVAAASLTATAVLYQQWMSLPMAEFMRTFLALWPCVFAAPFAAFGIAARLRDAPLIARIVVVACGILSALIVSLIAYMGGADFDLAPGDTGEGLTYTLLFLFALSYAATGVNLVGGFVAASTRCVSPIFTTATAFYGLVALLGNAPLSAWLVAAAGAGWYAVLAAELMDWLPPVRRTLAEAS